MVYARKINEDSWFGKNSLDSDSISELITTNHELSVWKVEDLSNEDKLNDIALALALSRDAVDEFYVVFIDLDKINAEPTLKSKACLKCLYFTKIISDLCRNLECFSYLYTINQTE